MQSNIRVLIIGAHPDDCESRAGGLAAKYRKQGHTVKFVSVTNGDAGHQKMGGPDLAARRLAESRRVTEEFGIEYDIWDIPDGRLVADLATRERLIREIRTFGPDLVITHRPNDYHPDHRATSTLVMDASYLIRVPNICPDIPDLRHTPVILYLQDSFTKPTPFTPDVALAIDDVIEEKARMLHFHESQMYEWLPYVGGYEPEVPASDQDRLEWIRRRAEERYSHVTPPVREQLLARYGDPFASQVRCAEAFEFSEYGRPLPSHEIDHWFPR